MAKIVQKANKVTGTSYSTKSNIAYAKARKGAAELIKWKSNPELNPRTNRKIKEEGKIYKYLKNCYDIKSKLKYNQELITINKPIVDETIYSLNDTVDDKDPISLNVFWIKEEGNKKIIYSDISSLIFYKDSYNLVRCFERESLEYLKAYNFNKHPITMEEIPIEIFKNICAKNLKKEKKTINDIAFEVFQKLATLSIFIDSKWFMDLDKKNLIKFNYEISDMYKQNFSSYELKEISNKILFSKCNNELDIMSISHIQNYLLVDIDILLSVKKEKLKYMCNYLLVGSLSIVIPNIRKIYPDICFSFTI